MHETDPDADRHEPGDADSWLEALAGREDLDPEDEATPRLRAAIREYESRQQGHRKGLEGLYRRLEHEGLLKAPAPPHRTRITPRRAVAASLVGIGVLAGGLWLGMTQPPLPPENTIQFRGFGTEVRIVVNDPREWIQDAERTLAQADCPHQRPPALPLVLIVDATSRCVTVLNGIITPLAIEVSEPGRYRLNLEP